MGMTGLEAIDTTVQKTNTWIGDIMIALGWRDRHKAYAALRAVLHALRDRLSVDEAVALGAQLPTLIRGIYYEGWTPKNKPVRIRHKDEFLSPVFDAFSYDPDFDAEETARTVFGVLASHVSPGEVRHIERILPREIAELWPSL